MKIAIVDDEKDICGLLSEVLSLEGFEVMSANSGREAMIIAKDHSLDLVLSDIQMLDGSGVWLMKELKDTFDPCPPVVFMSGSSSFTEKQILEMGASKLIRKATKVRALVEVCKAMFSGTRLTVID